MIGEIQVGFLGGTELSGNVRTLLKNLRRLLSSREQTFKCDLLTSDGIRPVDGYRTVTISHKEVETARDRIRTLTRGATQYARRERPDVLMQLTRFPTHGVAIALAGRRTNTQSITRLAGDNFREYQFDKETTSTIRTYALKNVIALLAVHLPDAVVVLGPNGRRDIERRLRNEKIWEIPQPVDRSRFTPDDAADLRRTLEIESDERMILTVGRVRRRKGSETIQRTAPSLERTTWVVVGEGPMRSSLVDIPNVLAVGRVPHDEIVEYYRAADLYVHPSLHEGLPNVLLEATACGTPCIARDVGECSSVAAETFSDERELYNALGRTYDSVVLPERFEDDRLAEQYCSLLLEVAC
ncbi:glycosyltransferase [Halobellus sp. Atlit-31R]|nr:glycosyltransferase [Halobellus sp. Atlit-31R]